MGVSPWQCEPCLLYLCVPLIIPSKPTLDVKPSACSSGAVTRVMFSVSGFTPLILAATAGHVGVVEILLDNGADIEAQSERTKDTPLSLACSGGRQEVK